MNQRFALKNDWMIGLRFYSQRHKAFSRIYAGIFPEQQPDQSRRKFNLFPFICKYQFSNKECILFKLSSHVVCDWSRIAAN